MGVDGDNAAAATALGLGYPPKKMHTLSTAYRPGLGMPKDLNGQSDRRLGMMGGTPSPPQLQFDLLALQDEAHSSRGQGQVVLDGLRAPSASTTKGRTASSASSQSSVASGASISGASGASGSSYTASDDVAGSNSKGRSFLRRRRRKADDKAKVAQDPTPFLATVLHKAGIHLDFNHNWDAQDAHWAQKRAASSQARNGRPDNLPSKPNIKPGKSRTAPSTSSSGVELPLRPSLSDITLSRFSADDLVAMGAGLQSMEADESLVLAQLCYSTAATTGHVMACYLAGLGHLYGWGCPPDPLQGVECLVRSAQGACEDIAKMRGDGGKEEQFQMLGMPFYELGQCFFQGTGSNYHPASALSYWRIAATLGDPDACQALAKLYLAGAKVKDHRKGPGPGPTPSDSAIVPPRAIVRDKMKAAGWFREAERRGVDLGVDMTWIWKGGSEVSAGHGRRE